MTDSRVDEILEAIGEGGNIPVSDVRYLLDQLAAKDAEIARLREALENIAESTAATWVSDAARTALGDNL